MQVLWVRQNLNLRAAVRRRSAHRISHLGTHQVSTPDALTTVLGYRLGRATVRSAANRRIAAECPLRRGEPILLRCCSSTCPTRCGPR